MRSALHEAHSGFYEFSNQQVVRVGKPTQRHNKGGFYMADLTHIFKVGQRVKCRMDEDIHDGVIKETFKDHVIIDIPDVSDHCWFEN